jgi:hypothetical protein
MVFAMTRNLHYRFGGPGMPPARDFPPGGGGRPPSSKPGQDDYYQDIERYDDRRNGMLCSIKG